MVRPVMKDRFFLSQKSAPATPEDAAIAQDLLDTLGAHRDGCGGLGAQPSVLSLMRRKRGVCPSVAPALQLDIAKSLCGIRMLRFRPVREHSVTGRHRSFSMRSIIAMEF